MNKDALLLSIKLNVLKKMGKMYADGIYIDKDLIQSAHYYEEAIDAGDIDVLPNYLSTLWWINTPESINKMIDYSSNASNKNNSDC